MKGGNIQLLLNLARSWKEGIQSKATKGYCKSFSESHFCKLEAGGGMNSILASLARSMNRLVVEKAARGVWNIAVGEEHKGAIYEVGGIKSLADLLFKWPRGVME